jgi:hypothetical protein
MPSLLVQDRQSQARSVLAANDRGGYTVPTARLYPFQWNWDSAFVAMGFATYDVDRAYRELERLVEGQWPDGMIPQIVFHASSDDYFPGPDVWGTDARRGANGPRTSGITQPPVFATALRAIDDAARAAARGDRAIRSVALYRAALAWHRWWIRERDPDATGLVAILHNWESGSDNSPAWDDAFSRVPTTTTTVIRRKDTGHVDAAMRPRDVDYARYIHLVDRYRAVGWEPREQWRIAPFKIADVQMSAILACATEDLIALSREFGTADEQAEIAAMHKRLVRGLQGSWSHALGHFVSRDLVAGRDIGIATQAGFMPIAALDLEPEQIATVVREIERWIAGQAFDALPSVPQFSPAFDAKRYWRGPIWAIINWYIVAGLRRNGEAALASRLERGMITAMEQSGFAEYFDPVTGEGCGGLAFSWTAAAYLLMTQTRKGLWSWGGSTVNAY